MKISDLSPEERKLLFLMRLCDAMADPAFRKQHIVDVVAEYDVDTPVKGGDGE